MIIPPPDIAKDELVDATVIAVGNEGATVDTGKQRAAFCLRI